MSSYYGPLIPNILEIRSIDARQIMKTNRRTFIECTSSKDTSDLVIKKAS